MYNVSYLPALDDILDESHYLPACHHQIKDTVAFLPYGCEPLANKIFSGFPYEFLGNNSIRDTL